MMDLEINKPLFVRLLRLAQSIAQRKGTMPMLANVLLRASPGKLIVGATDLNVSLTATVPIIAASTGGLAVGAKALFDIVSNLPGDSITLREVENHWLEVKSGKVKFRIVGVPDRDFPKMPDARDIGTTEVNAVTFLEMVDRTLFSVCNDETRFHLNGVLFESPRQDEVRMVSTDGHRLSKVDRPMVGCPKLSSGMNNGVIIPKKGLLEIKKMLGGATTFHIGVKSNHVFLVVNDQTLAVKLVDAQFPPYDAVIPKDHKNRAVVDRAAFTDAVKRSGLMATETRGLKFTFAAGSVTVSSDNPDVGDVTETVDAEYTGTPFAIGLNPRYLIDLLAQIHSDQVALDLGGELDPAVVRPLTGDDYLGVIMPMRI